MFKAVILNCFILVFFTLSLMPKSYSDNVSTADNGEAQGQPSFPFDKPCLAFDKANFTVGPALLAVMTENDFPQYCVLYSLSDYQVEQKMKGGYFITGSKLEPRRTEAAEVFLKSDKLYEQNQVFAGNGSAVSKPAGQWAYFKGPAEFTQKNGAEKEMYVFQEIDF